MANVREMSETGFYHLVTRGVGKMVIFEDDTDRRFYLRMLKKYATEEHVRIIAWVLMSNHVHLVVDMGRDELPTRFMQRLNTTYAMYFKERTEHVGHVFQNRYWSGPINDDEQLIATVDYIHRNPERARLASKEEYRWSSYQEYLGKRWVVDTSLMLELFGSLDEFRAYQGCDEKVVRYGRRPAPDDEEVLNMAASIVGLDTSGAVRSLDEHELRRACRVLASYGVSERQLGRVFGRGRRVIHRLLS
ncbi:MAG: transposase [Coriobacteriales bacterium]|nr:transposase [Coriobacteriales bacterium]